MIKILLIMTSLFYAFSQSNDANNDGTFGPNHSYCLANYNLTYCSSLPTCCFVSLYDSKQANTFSMCVNIFNSTNQGRFIESFKNNTYAANYKPSKCICKDLTFTGSSSLINISFLVPLLILLLLI